MTGISAYRSGLQNSRQANSTLASSVNNVATGRHVNSAADNAAYWAIATTMNSDHKALSSVGDALALGAAQTDTAYLGTAQSISILQDIKAKLVLAREPGVDRNKINTEISSLKDQLKDIAEAANFGGQNWLKNTSGSAPGKVDIVNSFNRDASGNVSVGTTQVDTAQTTLVDDQNPSNGILTASTNVIQPNGAGGTTPATYYLVSGGTPTAGTEIAINPSTKDNDIDGMISAVDSMLSRATDSAATLGATSESIQSQSTIMKQLQDSIAKSTSKLVDTDMGAESVRMKAASIKAELATQMHSITNSNANAVLQLFR